SAAVLRRLDQAGAPRQKGGRNPPGAIPPPEGGEGAPTPQNPAGERPPPMSALGQKWTFAVQKGMSANSDRESGLRQTVMSALPPKADMCSATLCPLWAKSGHMQRSKRTPIRSPRRWRGLTAGWEGLAPWRLLD